MQLLMATPISHKEGSFVENIVLDVEDVEAEEVWKMVRKAVLVSRGCDLGRQPSNKVVL